MSPLDHASSRTKAAASAAGPEHPLDIEDVLQLHPVIASVKNAADAAAVLETQCPVVIVLFGSILTIPGIVEGLKNAGKTVFVDVDLIEGFSSKTVAIDFLQAHTSLDGILSTKAMMVKYAKSKQLLSIHRAFLVDSFSYHNLPKQLAISGADAVEILPGCMPRVLSWLKDMIDLPVIAGGLVCDKQDVVNALGAGAIAIASSNREVWGM